MNSKPHHLDIAIVDALHQDKCTALHGVPTHFLGVLGEVARRRRANEEVDLSKLRFVLDAL